jgi:ABC-type nitrate/sulfonate/bicarbonate transport system permease component
LVLGILLALSLAVVEQSIVVGRKGVIEAIRESFDLFWNNKATIFLVELINLIISVVLGIVLGVILGLIPVVGSSLGSIITSLILTPFLALIITYLYLDLSEETSLEIMVKILQLKKIFWKTRLKRLLETQRNTWKPSEISFIECCFKNSHFARYPPIRKLFI